VMLLVLVVLVMVPVTSFNLLGQTSSHKTTSK
jgi:hypothetical protein